MAFAVSWEKARFLEKAMRRAAEGRFVRRGRGGLAGRTALQALASGCKQGMWLQALPAVPSQVPPISTCHQHSWAKAADGLRMALTARMCSARPTATLYPPTHCLLQDCLALSSMMSLDTVLGSYSGCWWYLRTPRICWVISGA